MAWGWLVTKIWSWLKPKIQLVWIIFTVIISFFSYKLRRDNDELNKENTQNEETIGNIEKTKKRYARYNDVSDDAKRKFLSDYMSDRKH